MKNKYLTIILPIRITEDSINLLDKISNYKLDIDIPSIIDFIIVDDGSEEKYSILIQSICSNLSIKYIYLNTTKLPFSLARIRNNGAKEALTPYIMFQDLDMLPYKGFYNDLINEINIQNLKTNRKKFIMISCIYLTEEASATFDPNSKQFYLDKLLIRDKKYIDKFSSGTSLILLNKDYFFEIGGYDEKFFRWGHEDIDLNCRLILKDNLYKLPQNFLKDEKNFSNIFQYEGWKSIYRLYGDRTFYKGIVLFHDWHETTNKNDYYSNKKKNKELFHKKLLEYFINYKEFKNYELHEDSILLDRYKYSNSPQNRLKCKSFFFTIYNKIKKKFI